MTLTVDSHVHSNPIAVESDAAWDERIGSEDVGLDGDEPAKCDSVRRSFNAEKCLALLDEPAIGMWAIEAASDYGVALDDALELLAYALFLDGEK